MKQVLTLLTLVFAVTMTLFIASGSAHAVNNEENLLQKFDAAVNAEQLCILSKKSA